MNMNSVEMQLRVKAQGIKEAAEDAGKVRNNLKGAADEAERLSKAKPPKAAYGGTAGSRAAAAQAAPAGLSGTEYGNLRGSAGATGASARDFANQAQGLGGLVRLYATYAANLFAVTAAYNALSQAMNTDNMVKGMDQLGAASGIAMGTLAKSFAKASGGAISLRESMESTAKAISSGMSQKQFLQLGDVAKKASQALGVNMSDAVSRLTRGITKLEPELLDELGLFTRVDSAVKDYAKSLGRSEASLTSFERRQAFANAVLKEGIDKFGEISIDTNPYDLLTAKLKDTAQSILSVVNTVVGPIAKIMSESTALVTASIIAMAAMLVRQVIPIIGHYNAYMAESAKKAREVALVRATAAKAAMDAEISLRAEKIKSALEGKQEAATARLVAAETDLATLSKRRMSKEVRMLLDPTRDLTKLTEKELANLDDLSNKRSKRTGELTHSAKIYDTIKKSILEAIAAQKQFNKAVEEEERLKNQKPGYFSPAARAARNEESARRSYASKSILSEVSENTSTYGMVGAIKEMNAQVKAAKLGGFRSALVMVQGAATAAGTAVMGLAASIGNVVAVVGLVIAGLSFLYSLVSANSKEIEAFNNSIDTSSSNMEAAALTAKKYGDTLTPKSIEAKSTALTTLAEGLEDVALKASMAEQKANVFDRLWDSIKGSVGYGMKDDISQQTQLAIDNAYNLINDPELKKKFLLKVQVLMNNKTPKEFYKDMDTKEAVASFSNFSKKLTEVSQASSLSAGLAGDAIDSVKTLADSYKELEKSLIGSKDPASELGKALLSSAQNFNKALESPKEALVAITELLNSNVSAGIFGQESIDKIAKAKKDLEDYNKELIQINGYLAQAKGLQVSKDPTIKKQGLIMEEASKIRQTELKAQIKATMSALSTEFQASMNKGLQLIEAPLRNAIATAANATSATLAGMLPDNTEAIKAKLKVDTQAIKIQMDSLKASFELVNALKVSALVTEKQNKLQELSLKMKDARDSGDTKYYGVLRTEYENTEKQYNKDIDSIRNNKYFDKLDSNTNPAVTDARIAFVGYRASLVKLESQMQSTILQSWYAELKKASEARLDNERKTVAALVKENKDYYESVSYARLNPVEQDAEKRSRDTTLRNAEQQLELSKLREALGLLNDLDAKIKNTGNLTGRKEMLDSIAKAITTVTEETDAYIESTVRSNIVAYENNELNTETVKTLYELSDQQKVLETTSRGIDLEQQKLDAAKQLYDKNLALMALEVESGRMSQERFDLIKKKEDEAFAIKTAQLEISKLSNDIEMSRLSYAVRIVEALKEGKLELASSLAKESADNIAKLEDEIKNKKNLLAATIKEIRAESDTWFKTLRDTLTSSVIISLTEGGKAGYANLKNSISQISKENFTIVISAVISDGLEQLLRSIKDSLTSKGSISSSLKESTKKFDSNISDKFNKFASGDVGKFLKLTDSEGKLTKLGQFGSSVAKYGGRALAGYGMYKSLSGGYSTGLPKGLMNIGAGVGSAIFGPWVGAAMGVFNRAFGRKLADSGIVGKVTKDGFTGKNYEFYKGGLLRSNKTKTSDMSQKEQDSIAYSLNMTKKGVADLATGLGLNSKKILEYTKDIKISFKNLTQEQAAEKLAKELEKFGEELAKTALGTSDFKKVGETSTQTLQRLSQSLVSVNEMLGNINVKLFDVSLSGGDSASRLADMLGGLDSAQQKISNYYTKFFTSEEQLANLRKQVNKEIKSLSDSGYTSADGLVDTNDEFRALVESLDLVNESDKEAFTSLMNLADSFNEVTTSANQSASSIEDILLKLRNQVRSNEDIANNIISLEDTSKNLSLELLKLTGSTDAYKSALRESETKGLTPAEIAIYDYNNSLQDQIDAINNYVKSVDELLEESKNAVRSNQDIANSIISLQGNTATLELELLKLTGSTDAYKNALRESETKGLTPAEIAIYDYNNRLQDQIDAINNYVKSVDELLEESKNAVRSNQDIANSIISLQGNTATLELELLKLTSSTDAYKNALRDLETKGFTEAEIALYDYNTSLQDQIDTYNKLSEASQATKEAMTSLLDAIVSQGNYREDYKTKYVRDKILDNTEDSLKSLQEYAFVIEDVNNATEEAASAKSTYLSALDDEISKHGEAVDKLKSTRDTLKGFISTLRDFTASLKLGADSILSPIEKYDIAKSKFQEIFTTATTSTNTELREQAIEQLSGAASEFLSASREVNASSIAYTSDFNSVTSKLDSLEGVLSGDLTDTEQALQYAEEQLSVLEEQRDSLKGIAETLAESYTKWTSAEESLASIKNSANLALSAAYQTALSAGDTATANVLSVGAYASGGLATGVSIVGEKGPELVDFNTPGRVYSNNDSVELLGSANNEVIAELVAMRKEVEKLRTQQTKETGAILNGLYDSQNKNAQVVAEAVEEGSKKQVWNTKLAQNATLV